MMPVCAALCFTLCSSKYCVPVPVRMCASVPVYLLVSVSKETRCRGGPRGREGGREGGRC
jgi:hypothetical protein